MQLFVDMDGVLADFNAHHEAVLGVRPAERLDDAGWSKVRAVKERRRLVAESVSLGHHGLVLG